MPNCSFCDRQAYADAEIESLGKQWLYVCKFHFIEEECSFREGKAEVVLANAPEFNAEADEVLVDLESFIKEMESDVPNV